MPEHVQEQTKPTHGNQPQHNQQPQEHPRQPIEVQPDGTWILGRGADRWIPSENQIGDLRWLVERDLRRELGVPPKTALNKDKIEFHKRQLALLDLAKQAPRCEHVFSDGRCCKAPRVKKGKLCYAHTLMEEKRPQELNLPPLEDANAVMLWLMDVLRGLAEGRTSEKTAGVMLYGLQLAMVNARFTTFKDVKFEEMVTTVKKPQRAQRNTKKKDITAKDAKVAKEEGQRAFTAENAEEARALPQRTQRNTEQDFTAEVAENAEEFQRDPVTAARNRRDLASSPEERALPQRAQRNTEEEPSEDLTAKGAKAAKEEEQLVVTAEVADKGKLPQVDFTAEAEENAGEASGKKGLISGTCYGIEPQNEEVNPGVESAKSLFFGVEAGEGVADNRPISQPPEPPRKSSQSEILVIPKDVEHQLGR